MASSPPAQDPAPACAEEERALHLSTARPGSPAYEERQAALRAWLPPAAELVRICQDENECAWRANNLGGALLCAKLHGDRLGDWAAAAEVCEGLLAITGEHGIEQSDQVVYVEVCKLLEVAEAELESEAAAARVAERQQRMQYFGYAQAL